MSDTRPATISELAAAAQSDPDLSHTSKNDIKYYIRRAETHRKDGKALASGATKWTGDVGTDLEFAFIEYARSATLIVEKIPSHRDYMTALTAEQRSNLTANGQDILMQLGRIKATLVERYERYSRGTSNDPDAVPSFTVALSQPRAAPVQKAPSQTHAAAQRAVADEAARWRAQREDAAARDAASYRPPAPSAPSPTSAQSYSAASGVSMPIPASLVASGGHPVTGGYPQPSPLPPSFGRGASQSGPASTYPLSAGVSFPAPPTPQSVEYPNPHSHSPAASSSSSSYAPSTSSYAASGLSSASSYDPQTPTPGPMPLRAEHTDYDWESTDSESTGGGWRAMGKRSTAYPEPSRLSFPAPSTEDLALGMSGLNVGSPSTHISVKYPSLARHMSSHQRTQGYVPGASRWGNAPPLPPPPATSSPISPTDPNENRAGMGATAAMNAARAAAASTTSVVSGPTTFVPMPDPAIARREREEQRERERGELRAAAARADREREEREKGKTPRLRTVVLPQVTLSRFLAIASANTARNLETCGLLLGREVARSSHAADGKTRYVVETLLIPKQHATSDTCTMDEEEGVMMFTEERGLITLGWIHTHPSQSCFMSSVDLHTHASFQRMLPESFAVVCAPKSDPSFGIFRLTDPPGLQTVLTCTATQAFHPHPDLPIYTDADKGHVLMRDAALEIVDLR